METIDSNVKAVIANVITKLGQCAYHETPIPTAHPGKRWKFALRILFTIENIYFPGTISVHK